MALGSATVHAQIRDRLAAMKTGRTGFLEKNAADPAVATAATCCKRAIRIIGCHRIPMEQAIMETEDAKQMVLMPTEELWCYV
jgi:hypothetical protein